jgi:DNA polymerase beta
MVLTKVPERILPGASYRLMDVRLCNTTSVPYFLLANTGDDTLMKIMRKAAFDRYV